jgi:hypothetical protein
MVVPWLVVYNRQFRSFRQRGVMSSLLTPNNAGG